MKRNPFMTAGEARAQLGISPKKLAALIREGVLTTEPDPLDKRVKLVRRADVEALAEQSSKTSAAA
jgi:hypothetical protein